MGPLSRMVGVAGLATVLFSGLATASAAAAPGQPVPMPLLTDTPQYCAQLSNMVEAGRQSLVFPAPPEIERLAAEGRRLCALGEIRAGVTRLRQAIVLLRKVAGQS